MTEGAMTVIKWVSVAALFVYGIPLWKLRYKWRSTVYRMTSWKINILPWFGHDTAALFSNRYFQTPEERQMAFRFRVYLVGYSLLFAWVLWIT
ncbi:MAG: hypothetical protein ACT4QD_25635 [Acidobacteriota bacterium]